MFITANTVQHSQTKHIVIRYHLLRDNPEKGLIILIKVHTDLQLADLFTKSFSPGRFEFLIQSIGLINHH